MSVVKFILIFPVAVVVCIVLVPLLLVFPQLSIQAGE